ncbi:MAG: hypothetical protein CVT70_11655 [Alphaproteobacteria bacterium HGW-Alphaproteobacteria-1]|jgi:hypothetical protein|nr:MAG: hypothetical protein CVT70_11655 [Alphaproteobacteria bacterium HGW-Alphaproteobacteria-1]
MAFVLRFSLLFVVLGGCSLIGPRLTSAPPAAPPPDAIVIDAPEPTRAPPQSPRASLPATTVASLGNVREPGLWMRTPLVSDPMRGTVRDPATGRSVAVDLIPIAGAPGAGSRMSLAAYQALGLSLTALPELRVSAGG